MQRLTGKDCGSLMNAYSAVYNKDFGVDSGQEKNIAEFLQVIDELIEEGYDLSQYTYDDLYGYYLNEGVGKAVADVIRSGIRSGLKMSADTPIVKTIAKNLIRGGSETATKVVRDVSKAPGAVAGTVYRGVRDFASKNPLKTAVAGTVAAYDLSQGPNSLIGKGANITGQGLTAAKNFVYGDPSNPTAKPTPTPAKPGNNWYDKVKEGASEVYSQKQNITEDPKIVYAPKGSKPGAAVLGPDGKVQKWQELNANDPQVKAKEAEYGKLRSNQATQQRTDLGVVAGGGKSGYTVSTTDKPRAGETTQQWQSRRGEALKLSDRLNKEGGLGKYKATTPSAPAAPKPAPTPTPTPGAPKPAPTPTPTPGAPKPAPTPTPTPGAPKPAPTPTPSKPVGSPMDQWRAANPKLAAAADEKARIRGTNQTDNPLMKDMGSSLPAPTSSQSPSVAKLGAGNQSLTNNPNVPKQFKPPVTAATSSTSPIDSVSTTNKIAAMKNQPDLKPQAIAASYQYDAYDLVLEYLLDNGHVDTLDEAHYVMMQMSAKHVQDIVEGGYNSSTGRYDLGDGSTVGPVAGAVHALFTGNLPKSQAYIPPSKQTGVNRPPAIPPSKDDSGKSTDFGDGGGKTKMQQSGMTVGQVERQGRRNKGDYSR